MTIPSDPKLYKETKTEVYTRIPNHSAYRSGLLVKQYKKNFRKKYGTRKKPYYGKRKTNRLTRWFRENWTNQRGEIGYKYKNDVYRPNKRINKHTPKTFNELSNKRIQYTRRQKYRKGRVTRF